MQVTVQLKNWQGLGRATADRLHNIDHVRVFPQLTTSDRDNVMQKLALSTCITIRANNMNSWDCIVIGSGHAGSCAALSAAQSGSKKILIVDKCPKEWAGGNGFFTAGAHRTVHGGLSDLLPLVDNVSPQVTQNIDMDPYTYDNFTSDIMRLAGGKSNPSIVHAVVSSSREIIGWLSNHVKVPFTLSFNRQAYEVDGRQKFWGGMVLSVQDGGKGLMAAHQRALDKAGVDVWFNAPAVELIMVDGAIAGVIVEKDGKPVRLNTRAIVLAAGGFEANPILRARHLGPEWEHARVGLSSRRSADY